MTQDNLSVEDRIIQAAIECIEKYGIQGTTNRKIAEMAGVNGAAINYYFRSKDALIEKCMLVTLHNAFDWEDFANLPSSNPKERCAAIFLDLIRGACSFPGITRAHYQDIIDGKYNSPVVKKLNEFLIQLVQDLRDKGAQLDDHQLRLAVAQIASSAMMLALIPSLYKESFGLDICSEEDREEYIQRLVDRLL